MGAEVDKTQLASLLGGLKELPPKIRRDTRRDLRGVGDGVIAAQREILSGPLPAGVEKVGQRSRLEVNKKTGKFRVVKRNVYGDAERKNAQRSTGMREAIKAGLKTRVVTGAKRQGIDVTTTGPRQNGFNQAKVWNLARFRHPTFGRPDSYVYQGGQPYFYGPVRAGYDDMLKRAEEILTRNINEV